MIRVERLNGEEVFINPDLIRSVVKRPDTILTFLDGNTMTIRGNAEEFFEKWKEFRSNFPPLPAREPQWK